MFKEEGYKNIFIDKKMSSLVIFNKKFNGLDVEKIFPKIVNISWILSKYFEVI